MTAPQQHARITPVDEIVVPVNADDWHALYPNYLLFDKVDKSDRDRFWYLESLHHPRALRPFETIILDAVRLGFNQFTNKTFVVPQSCGLEQRIIGGYAFFSPLQPNMDDHALIERRKLIFQRRASAYFRNWDERWSTWKRAMCKLIDKAASLDFSPPPQVEADNSITDEPHQGSAIRLLSAYSTLVETLLQAWQLHFEMLNLGYGAQFLFRNCFQQHFPAASEHDLAALFAGTSTLLQRPFDEISRLAHLARELKVDTIIQVSGNWNDIKQTMADSDGGDRWLREWYAARDPWFHYSTGSGLYSDETTWYDDPELPLTEVRRALRDGIVEPVKLNDVVKEREARFLFYRDLISLPDQAREFETAYRTALTVAPYIEDHNFFVEHWYQGVFWRQMRRLGGTLVVLGFLDTDDDVFFFTRWEISELLFQAVGGWLNSIGATEGARTKDIAARRRTIHDRLSRWTPPAAAGIMPASITDPVVAMLWGIDDRLLEGWRRPDQFCLHGIGASAGIAEGPVVRVRTASDLDRIQKGDIVVCRTLIPAWTSAFARAGAVVSEIGGMLSHGAICCRERGVPAVASVPSALETLVDGMQIQVDGFSGRIQLV